MATKELSSLAVSIFCEDLAMMLQAGIQPDEAAGLLAEDSSSEAFQQAARSMQKSLILGSSLSQAADESGIFPQYAVKMIAAGELSGRTDTVLRSLSRHYAGKDQLEKKLKSAVVYPGVLLGLMALILVVLVTKVLPVFTSVYESLSGSLAASSFSYIRIAYFVGWAGLLITLLLAVVLLTGLALSRTTAGRTKLSALFEKLPFTAAASRRLALAHFSSALSVFIASGVDTDTALEAAGAMTDHRGVSEQVERCKQSMASGTGLATAIFEEKLFEPLYGRMLVSGARSGQLESVLAHLGELFQQDADTALDRLIDSIEPILAGFLTVIVGSTLLSVMLPLISILGSIG